MVRSSWCCSWQGHRPADNAVGHFGRGCLARAYAPGMCMLCTWYYQQCTAAAWHVRAMHTAPTAVVIPTAVLYVSIEPRWLYQHQYFARKGQRPLAWIRLTNQLCRIVILNDIMKQEYSKAGFLAYDSHDAAAPGLSAMLSTRRPRLRTT